MNENDTLNSVLDKAELTDELKTQLQQARDLETEFRERETALRDRELQLQQHIATLEAQLSNLQETKTSISKETTLPAPSAEASSSDDEISIFKDAVKLLVQSQTQLNQKLDLFLKSSTYPSFSNPISSPAPSHSASTAKDKERITKNKKHDSPNTEDGSQMTSHKKFISRVIDQIMAHNNNAKSYEDKWYIGIRPLKDVINYQIPISQVIKQRKDEIRQHHQLHQINQRHNGIHHPGLTYNDFFNFD